MLPALHSFSSSRLLACMRRMRPKRSRLPRVEFSTAVPLVDRARVDAEEREVADERVVHDLERERRERLVVARLARRASCSCLSGSMPLTGGMSSGDGRKFTTASSSSCTPLFLKAEPQSTGHELEAERRLAERRVDLVVGDLVGVAVEELLHDGVVDVGAGLDHLFAELDALRP